MKNALIAILLCGAAVVWFGNREEEPKAIASDTSWHLDARGDDGKDGDVRFSADTAKGEMRLKLPGGIEGKMRLPDGLAEDTKFELDGVGRYPGAKLISVDVSGGKNQEGRVMLGFSAPGSADTVADWYEKALIAKGRTVARTGNTITGAN